MTCPSKLVFYVEKLLSPAFERVISSRPDVPLRRLTSDTPANVAAATLAEARGYQIDASRQELPAAWHGTADLLTRAPNLLVISSNGAGYDTIDVAACTEAGVLAVNQAGGNREGVAEHALGLMLALSKRIAETDHFMRRQPGIKRNLYTGHDLLGRTVGIIGLGHVGTRIAELCRGLFAMRILAFDPYLSAEQVRERGAEKMSLEALLEAADYVSVNCPLTADSRGMLGAREFALMRPHAYFINTARGFIHDETALAATLRDKRIAGAGLDVWEEEPPPHDHPLMAFDNVLVSPHTAGVTFESRDNISRIAGEQMLAILDGHRPERLLNPQVWQHYRDRYRRIMGVDTQD